MRKTITPRAAGAVAAAVVLTLSASACGADDGGTGASSQSGSPSADGSASPSSGEAHNDADVAFASDMLQHHAQALTMVEHAEGRRLDPPVQRLAEQIRAAQAPEIETFTTWLTAWGEEVPEGMEGHDMGHGASDMPGMMSDEDMDALKDAPGSDFQTMWLEMMIEHHRGAVEMARTQQAEGQYGPAVDLAGDIVTSQTAEIETMEKLLGR